MEPIALHDGRILQVHNEGDCIGPNCCIHKPSVWALSTAPLSWRDDRRFFERICKHGVGHPDVDDLAFKEKMMPDYKDYAFEVHGCDGCCRDI